MRIFSRFEGKIIFNSDHEGANTFKVKLLIAASNGFAIIFFYKRSDKMRS